MILPLHFKTCLPKCGFQGMVKNPYLIEGLANELSRVLRCA